MGIYTRYYIYTEIVRGEEMKASLMGAIAVFIASLAAFGSAVGIVGAFVSSAWIVYVLRRCDRAEVINAAEVNRDV